MTDRKTLTRDVPSTLRYGSGPYDCTCHVYIGSVGMRRVPDPTCPVHRKPSR